MGGGERKEIWSEVSVKHNGAEDPKTGGTFKETQVPLFYRVLRFTYYSLSNGSDSDKWVTVKKVKHVGRAKYIELKKKKMKEIEEQC